MGYKKKIEIELDLDEIRIISNALRSWKNQEKNDLDKSITKTGKAKKGFSVRKDFLKDQLKKTEKLETFFNSLF